MNSDETLAARPRPAKAAPSGPPGKPAKVRGPWSVGTPIAVFAILGFLGVGTLYGFVWAGTFDWKIPPWVRTLTGRDAAAEIPDTVKILERASIPMILNVEFTLPEIRKPMDAEARPPVYGTWRVIKDPPGASGPAESGAAPPDVKVFASGDLAGVPSETGVIPVAIPLPPGKYQLEGTVWCGTIGRRDAELKPIPCFEVGPDKKSVVSFMIETRPTTLTVNIRPQAKAVITIVNASVGTTRKPLQKEIARGEGAVRFGLDSDMAKGRLFLGETWIIKVAADGKKPKEQPVTLDGEPTTAEVNLEEDPQGKVGQAKKLILETELMPPEFENDPAVLGSPEIMVAMATVCVKNRAWPKVEDYMLSLMAVEPKSLPAEAGRLYSEYHKHLRELGQESATKGDVVRVREFRAKARPDVLDSASAAEEKKAWAEIEATAWLGFPQGATAADAELEPVQRMVQQDITLLPDPLRKKIAQRLIENRAWPAWRAGNELRPPSTAEKATSLTVPGPAVQPWIVMAKKAYNIDSDPVLLLSWQRLSARLEDLENRPENVVKLLAGDAEWNPGKGILENRKDVLFKKDRLLLARALARWGALREQANSAEATKLREIALQVYQTCFDPEVNPEDPERAYPESLAAAARAEAVGMAVLAKDAGTVQKLLDMYLALRGGDDWARRLKEDLNRPAAIPVPTLMQGEGLLVEIPGGLFLVGSSRSVGEQEEQPFRDPKAGVIKVNVLHPQARTRVQPFLVGVREVTWGQYKNYIEEMKTAEKVRMYAHPAEPTEKTQPGARAPERTENWADGDPVRGVDWWDAYACARYLGGRLPTEAEWEKAARWCGREIPFPDPMPAYRADFTVEFIKYWKDNMRDLSVFDVAPSGARGFWGGVSEWTLDSFKLGTPAPKDGIVDGVAPWPTVLPSDNVMCVRGGSNYHLPPGEAPGDSPLETKEKSREPPPAPGVQPPPERARVWRAMDILERRGVPAGTRAKWLGFRIVVGVPASTTSSR